ncbi:MAG: GNAT family N-acetyltransferase [Clostridia bacterium]
MDIIFSENTLTAETYNALRIGADLSPIESAPLCAALAASHITLTASLGTTCVGMLRVIGDCALFCTVCDVLILPGYRGHGIGHAMLARAISLIKSSAPVGSNVVVSLVTDAESVAFYESLGFALNDKQTMSRMVSCRKRYFLK